MSEACNLALTRLRAELNCPTPRPVEVLEFIRALEEHGNPSNIAWKDLQHMNAVPIMGDAIIHLKGWRQGMTDDPHERVCILDVYRGDNMSNGVLKMVLTRFPRRTRNRYLADYGHLVRNGNWNDFKV